MAQADCKKTDLTVSKIEEKHGVQINHATLQTHHKHRGLFLQEGARTHIWTVAASLDIVLESAAQ